MTTPYCTYIIDQLKSWAETRVRKMFGGYGLYRGSVMFGIIDEDVLYFKVDNSNHTEFESAGSQSFTYNAKGKEIALSYWMVPAEILEDEDKLGSWAEKSYRVALKAKTKSNL